MWQTFLSIGAGAALGAWLRYGLSLWLNPLHNTVPLGTLTANLLGGYVIGLALAFFATRPELSPQWRLFVVTGLLGGLTTFSTFSAEVVYLLQRQQLGWGLLTIGLHLGGSLSMTALGWWTWRSLRLLT
ncbi:fluoride efflux transporter CrcB [Stenotrophomonas sp. UBA7606]|uniref:fluoride efflux transporter CrcB n=1 Tax=Stenotrophomonas sp. UBA7606 TaxID=1947559 RepID=UPI0025E13592|nr:fluoride efflux transporter CrcB [Stenotrophomonas sp. UBA7606]